MYRRSLDVGSVRLSERHFPAQPPPPDAVHAAAADVRAALAAADAPRTTGLPLVAAAGTATTLGLLHAGARTLDALEAEPVVLSAGELADWRRRLLAMRYDDVMALWPELMAGRADVFPCGVLVLDELMRYTGAACCRISPRALRHGLALRLAARLQAEQSGQEPLL